MKASEYVKFLQEVIEQDGDLELFESIADYDNDDFYYAEFGDSIATSLLYKHTSNKMSGEIVYYDDDPENGIPMEVFVVS